MELTGTKRCRHIHSHLEGQGLGCHAEAVLQAIDSAGYELQPRKAGTPAAVVQTVESARYRINGMKGAYLLAIDVPGKGSLVCVETVGADGKAERSPWVWSAGEATAKPAAVPST